MPKLLHLRVRSLKDIRFGVFMKRIAAFLLLFALSIAVSLPAHAQRENTSIGENGREARRAAKQQQKYAKKTAKKQRKAMKKYQKAQKKASKKSQRRHR
jgi:Skp family chaperone for outer membrane proteins